MTTLELAMEKAIENINRTRLEQEFRNNPELFCEGKGGKMGILEQIKYEYERRKTALAYENDRERLYD